MSKSGSTRAAPLTAVLLAMSVLFAPSPSHALDLGIALTPPAMVGKYVLRYSGSTQAWVHQQNANISLPLYRDEKDSWTFSSGFQSLDISPDQSSTPNLYNIQFGGTYAHQLEGGKSLSVNGSFGSASDRPFADSTVNTLSGTILYSFPNGPASSWLLLLNYSNNRPILNNIPLPGIAYTYAPSKTFRGTFGAPFASIYWQFADKWSVTSFTVAPWIIKTSVAYAVVFPMQIFAGVDFSQETFLQYGRSNLKDRIYYDEKKVFVGCKSPLSRTLFAELETGYALNRSMFSAQTYTLSPVNPTDLGSSFYGKLAITAAF